MLTGLNDDAYPILDGKAMVKVNLRRKKSHYNFVLKAIQNVRYSLLKIETSGYFIYPVSEEISMVKLSRTAKRSNGYSYKIYEHNLLSDMISPCQKLKSIATGVIAAGLMMFSTFVLAGKAELSNVYSVKTMPDVQVKNGKPEFNNVNKRSNSFVVSLSERENVVMASLSNPMDTLYMRKDDKHTNSYYPTHSNSGGTHTNIPGDDTHTNIAPTDPDDPSSGHTNLGGQHTNTAHTNYSGHNNGVEHTNVYDPNNG